MERMKIGKFYRLNDQGEEFVGQYIGTAHNTECIVCGKGHRCKAFNVFYSEDEYETWSYGDRHMPKVIEEVEA